MSKFDEAWKDYFSENSRFADIMNMFCFQGELLYKFLKTDRLNPVGTIVIYSGGKWTGPRSLWELCGIDKKLGKRMRIVNDYPLHIIELTELTESKLEQFRTDVKQVFSLLKNLGKRDKIKEVMAKVGKDVCLPEDANRMIELYFGKSFRNNEIDEEDIPMASIKENIEKMMERERERDEVRREGIKGMVQENVDENVPKERIVSKLMKYFKLSREDADKYVKMYAA